MPTPSPCADPTAAIPEKQRVVVLLPSNVDLACLDFFQVTDATCRALGRPVALSDLVLTVAQTSLVDVRKPEALSEQVRCKCQQQLDPCGNTGGQIGNVEEAGGCAASASVEENIVPASVAVEPHELNPIKHIKPEPEVVTVPPLLVNAKHTSDIPTPRTLASPAEVEKEAKTPAKPRTAATFNSALSRISAPLTEKKSVQARKLNPRSPQKPKQQRPTKSASHQQPSAEVALNSPQPLALSAISYLDPTFPDNPAVIPSCLLFPTDQSRLVANVAKEEEDKLMEMDTLDPVDVNYFLRLLQGEGAAAGSINEKDAERKKEVKKKEKKDRAVFSDDGAGMDVIERLRLRFMEELDEDSDGFGGSDDEDDQSV